MHPHHPTPENSLLGVGAYKRGGGIKFLPRGASKYTPPPPLKNASWPKNGGGGGGVYNLSLDYRWTRGNSTRAYEVHEGSRLIHGQHQGAMFHILRPHQP